MSLADELLADLEEIAEEGVEEECVDNFTYPAAGTLQNTADETPMDVDTSTKDHVNEVAVLNKSDRLQNVLNQLDYYQNNPLRNEISGPVESDPEYKLIVDANNMTVEIDDEIGIIHKFVRDHYSKRFPELESLVPMSLDYMKTVKELGNDLEKTKSSEILSEILTSATIMVVSVSASTTQGTKLIEEELTTVNEACNMAQELNMKKLAILSYVESRMTFIAPNLSIIVGASTAAKLMGTAGGLTNLSKMPSCNLMVLGSQKKSVSGFVAHAVQPHTGYVYYSEIVQNTPQDLRKRAARLVSSKSSLAARVDSFHESQGGTVGTRLREEIQKRLDKLQEPPPVKQAKPLPAPLDPTRKKRGGRRLRKQKEKLGMTETRKQANRMTFAEIEDDAYQNDLGYSSGQVGKTGTGRIRAPQADRKTEVKLSKSLQRKIQKDQAFGGRTTVRQSVAGTASTVTFTPFQGIEIVNPGASEMKAANSERYFSNTTCFVNVSQNKKIKTEP